MTLPPAATAAASTSAASEAAPSAATAEAEDQGADASDAAAEDDANRARSAVAAPRGFDTNEPGALPQLQLSDLRLTCSALCPEEGDARPRTFGGEEGGGHWAPSGGVLGDLPPISLGTPTGSNGLGR